LGLEDILKKTNSKLAKPVKKKPFSFGHDTPALASKEGCGDARIWIPTGIWPLDCALGGGLAAGRITELYSDNEGEGKTTLIIHLEKAVQDVGGTVVHFESESAMDKVRAAGIGLDLDDMIRWTPDTLEDGFRYLGELIKQIKEDPERGDKPTLIVWDTISMARTEAERDGDAFRDGLNAGPRGISQALKNYAQELTPHNVHLLLVNQSYTDINNKASKYLGTQYQTHGGKRIKFVASYRVKVKKCGYIGRGRTVKPEDEKLGIKVRVTIPKNKLALPFRNVELFLYGNTGYNSVMSMAHNFVEDGVFKWPEGLQVKTGGRYQPIHCPKSCYWHELEDLVNRSPDTLRAWQERWLQIFPIHESRKLNKDGWFERDPSVKAWEPTPDGMRK
jgi:RecA/RadA recombinase